MKVAVIGGSGFIGIHLIKKLSKLKNISIISTFKNKKLKNTKKVKWVKYDLNSKKKRNMYNFLKKPDVVINLSWPDIPNYLTQNHFNTYKKQKKMIKNLLNNGLKNLIVLGTCFEYGNINGKLSETLKTKPNTPYSRAKYQLLRSMLEFKKKNSFNLTWLRLFYVYGHHPTRDTLYNIINKLKTNKISSLSISGNLVRDYLSIQDAVKIMIKFINLKKDAGIVNVCSGKPITLKKLTKKILNNKNLLSKIKFNKDKSNSYEPLKFWGDTKKLKSYLNL